MDIKGLIRPLTQEYKRDEEEINSLSQAPSELNRLAKYCKSEVSLKIECLKEELDKYAQELKSEIDEIVQAAENEIGKRKTILKGNQVCLGECISILSSSPSTDDVDKVLQNFQSLPCVGMRNSNKWMPDLTIRRTQLFDKIANNLMPGDLFYFQSRREEAKSFLLNIIEAKSVSPLTLSISSENPISSQQFNSLRVELRCNINSVGHKIFLGPECRKRINDYNVEYVKELEDLENVCVFAFLNNEQITNSPSFTSGSSNSDIEESFQKMNCLDNYPLKEQNRVGKCEKDDAPYVSTPTLVGSNESLRTIIEDEENNESPIQIVKGLSLYSINEDVEGSIYDDECSAPEPKELIKPPSENKCRGIISAIIKHREIKSKEDDLIELEGSPNLPLNDRNNNINDTSANELNTSKKSGNFVHVSFEGLLEDTGNGEEELGSKSLVLDAPIVKNMHSLSKWETTNCLNSTPTQFIK